jgi:hypothetical protein
MPSLVSEGFSETFEKTSKIGKIYIFTSVSIVFILI